jgi:hypothetical protein
MGQAEFLAAFWVATFCLIIIAIGLNSYLYLRGEKEKIN